MFTGLYPSAFGSLRSRLATTSPIQTMTERFAAAGIETVAFTEGVLMSRRQGFWYGFDRFAEHGGTGRARETFERGIGFLERARDKQFFLFLHTYQTHKPYLPAPEYAKLYDQADDTGPHRLVPAEHRVASTDYDREIRQTDALLEKFFDRLDSLGLSATTYVAVISDHGEAFGEHHFLFHGRSAYQEELRIPFVIRGPGIPAGRVIDEPVSLVDIAPTLLDLLNAPRLAQSQGRSLAAALLENAPIASKPVFFEWIGRGNPRGVRHGHFKVLQRNRKNPHLILYDLETDPAEQRPIQGPHSARERGRELLAAHEEEGASRAAALAPTQAEPRIEPVPRDLREELRALGYIE